jgi:DNA mismatch endonuclease (patch repair protein)
MDRLTREHRSWNMSRIRGRDTRPELVVRSVLHNLGFRFRLNPIKLPGKPDVVLTRHRIAVFVHGCFWHRHADCRFAYEPKSNADFWTAKFRQNCERDVRNETALRLLGWRVLIVWECQAADRAALTQRLMTALKLPRQRRATEKKARRRT